MLDFLRKGAQSTAVKILFAIIIIVFVFWGVGTFRASRVDLLATVNGKNITVREYQTLYELRYRQLRQMFGDRVDEDFLKKIHFREQVLEELIRRRLMEEAARRMGISVHPREIQIAIARFPAFQEGGRFSFRRYRAVLRDLGIMPRDFEKTVKEDLLEARVRHFLTATIFAPETEVREYFEFQNQKLQLLYARLPYRVCARKVRVREKELREYFQKHRERYLRPPRIRLAYLYFPYARYRKNVHITEEEIKAYYQAQRDRFVRPERRKVRMILIRAEPGKKQEALKKAEALARKVKNVQDFIALARKYSQDRITAPLGGDLGEVKPGELFPAADRAVFSTPPGQVVGPLEGPKGYYLFYVEKVLPGGPEPLVRVKEKIRQELMARRAREAAYEAADDLYQKAVLAGSLKEAAGKEGLKLKELSFVQDAPPPPFNRQALRDALRSLEEGEISAPVEGPQGVLLFQILRKQPAQPMSFQEARKRVLSDFRVEKGGEVCRQKARQLLARVKKVSRVRGFFRKEGWSVQEVRLRRKELAQGEVPQAVARALGGRAEIGFLPQPVCDRQACYLVKIEKILPADRSDWDKEKEILFHVLTQEKRAAYFESWYRDLRQKAQVKLLQKWPQ